MSLPIMQQQMIYCLPTKTHDAPVIKIKTPTPQIITRKNPIPGDGPNKERDMLGCRNLPNTFPRKNIGRTMQLMIKRADIKTHILRQLPTHTITIIR